MKKATTEYVWGAVCRISDDPEDERAGVGRQTEDARDEVERQGGDPEQIKWFIENDTSAWKQRRVTAVDWNGNEYTAWRVIRPVWHEALHAIRTGEINALVVWDLDRLARDQRDLADAIEVVKYHGAHIVSGTASSIDLTTDSGIAMAQVMVAMAAKQSADTARRVKREHRAAAEAGIPRGGGNRPFGYAKNKTDILPTEATWVRWMYEQVIDGRTLSAIANDLNESGVTTTMGNAFVPNTLRAIVVNARYAGWRTDKQRNIVTKKGVPVRGLWEPIVDQDTFDRANLILSDPSRLKRSSQPGKRKYLLSGLLRCGICNGLMYGRRDERRDVTYYSCSAQRGTKHGLAVSGAGIDRVVDAQVALKLMEAPEAKHDAPAWAGQERLDEIDEMIADAMKRAREKPKMRDLYYTQVEELEEERQELHHGRTEWLAQTSGPTVKRMTADEWSSLSVEKKRQHIRNVLVSITVKPPTKKGPKFDPDRLDYRWAS